MSTLNFQPVSGNHIEIPLEAGEAGFRTVGDHILSGQLHLDAQDEPAVSEWMARAAHHGLSDAGDILSIATLNSRGYALFKTEPTSLYVPEYPDISHQLMSWSAAHSLKRAMFVADGTLIACVGARFHHDAEAFENNAFCVVWLSEDVGLDLVFPHLNVRLPLSRGTVALFDSGQVHGVIPREVSTWNAGDFYDVDVQFLLSFNIDFKAPQVAQCLGIETHADKTHPDWGSKPRLYGKQKGRVDDATGCWQLKA
jgi:hypothetical protein